VKYNKQVKEVYKPIPAKAPASFEVEATHLVENNKVYKYTIPEGYKPKKSEKPVLVETVEEAKEVEEKVELKEDMIKTPEEIAMDRITSTISKMVGTKVEEEPKSESILEQKIDLLEKQLYDIRKLMLENSQSTIVNSLGAGSPGSGEVRLNRLDDVNVPVNIVDGDSLVWDQGEGKWIPSSQSAIVRGAPTDIASIGLAIYQLGEKVASNDERLEKLLGAGLVELEENTQGGTNDSGPAFIDETPGGDITRFVVTLDPERKVYSLDGIPQPTVQVPRGDTLEFDTSNLAEPDRFGIYSNGKLQESGVDVDPGLITVDTSKISTDQTKLYYKDSVTPGIGWIINVTDF